MRNGDHTGGRERQVSAAAEGSHSTAVDSLMALTRGCLLQLTLGLGVPCPRGPALPSAGAPATYELVRR
jgi:hypothetical protein